MIAGRRASAEVGRHGIRGRAAAAAMIAIVVAACGAGCTSVSTPPSADAQLAIARGSAAPAAPAADRGALAASEINDFGFDLLRQLEPGGNLVASPASIALALGMVRPGARGQTATEMDKVLHSFGAGGQESEIRALLTELASQNIHAPAAGSPGPSADSPSVELDVAHEAFIQDDLAVETAYLDSLTSAYNAGVALVDYKHATEAARLLINEWASDQTHGRIPSILDKGDIDTYTRLVLVNAIYLEAAWNAPFDPVETVNRNFTTAGGTTVLVPTMAIDAEYEYTQGSGYQAIDLPYAFGGMSMMVVVPDDMASFAGGLTDSRFKAILAAESKADVDFQLPKFSLETRVSLVDALSAMGMPTAFNPDTADFSGMSPNALALQLHIKDVIHQANIDVVEEGTTAAAVTAVVVEAAASAVPVARVTFHVDRPFLYFIHDNRSGAVLFMGRVDDPTAK
jgi:serpin B